MIGLLLVVLVGLLIAAIAYHVSIALQLPPPIPLLVALAVIVVVILWVAGGVDSRLAS